MATAINEIPGAGALPVPVETGEDQIARIMRFAQTIAESKGLKPKLRGDIPTIFHILWTAEDLGLKWTHATRGMFLSDGGGFGMEGNIMLALLLAHGFTVDFAFHKDPCIGCTCTIVRPGEETGKARSFTLADAQRIRTEPKNNQAREWYTLADNFNFLNYPEDRCQWRALARCARVQAADVLGGIYLPDELEEATGTAGPAPEPEGAKPAPAAEEEFEVGTKPVAVAEVASSPGAAPETKPPAPETPAPKAADAPVVEMPKPEAAKPAIKYAFYLAVPREGKRPELSPMGAETPQSDKEVALLRGRAIANDRKMSCIVIRTVDGVPQLEENPAAIFNPPTTAAPPPHLPPAAQPAPSAPAPVAAPPADFDRMIDLVAGKLGGEKRAAHKMIGRYFASFLGVDTVPKDKTKLLPPLEKLAAVIDARVADLRTEPEKLGLALAGRAATSTSRLDQEFDALLWPSHVRELARKAMKAIGKTEDQFLVWIGMPVAGDQSNNTGLAVNQMTVPALEIFLPLYTLVKGRAFEVVDWAIARGKDVAQTLKEMETCSGYAIDTWDTPFAFRILDAVKDATTKVDAEPASAPPAPPLDDDWATGGLPFEK